MRKKKQVSTSANNFCLTRQLVLLVSGIRTDFNKPKKKNIFLPWKKWEACGPQAVTKKNPKYRRKNNRRRCSKINSFMIHTAICQDCCTATMLLIVCKCNSQPRCVRFCYCQSFAIVQSSQCPILAAYVPTSIIFCAHR